MSDFLDLSDQRIRFLMEIGPDDFRKVITQDARHFANREWYVFYNDLVRVCPLVADLSEQAKRCLVHFEQFEDPGQIDWNDRKVREAYVLYCKVTAVYHTLVVVAKRAMDSPRVRLASDDN